MSLFHLGRQIRQISHSKGFKAPCAENISEKVMLVVSELSEAIEELRDGHDLDEIYYKVDGEKIKPEGFPVEIADAIIRLLDIGFAIGINLDKVVAEKIAFNATREVKHGRLF